VPVLRRVALTSARDALNGYQKGACFYCYSPVSTVSKVVGVADVDHLFPRRLQQLGIVSKLDQVWNLVLACQSCNRGAMGKFELTPDLGYVARLERRNEYLIASHHPLRETLMA
jgi:5-methylcytosine-specific restriction endonuclease McrA